MSRHSLDHAQSPQTGTHPSSQAQMSISQLLIRVGVPSPTPLILPHALFFLQRKPTCLPWTGTMQPPPAAEEAWLRGQDSGDSWCGQGQGYQIRFMRCRKKASQADSVVWTLVSSAIFNYLQYWRHRAGRYDKKLWVTHAPKERQLESRQHTLRPLTCY